MSQELKLCERADIMMECFNVKHREELNNILQSKLGEYADITVNTVADENGGDIELSLGVYDVREALLNFAKEVANKINSSLYYKECDLTEVEVSKMIRSLLDNNNVNMDIEWENNSVSNILYYNDKNYKEMVVDNECDYYNHMILEELHNSVNEFLNNSIKEAVRCFNEVWVYNYSSLED